MIWRVAGVVCAAGVAGWLAGYREVLLGVGAPVVAVVVSWVVMTRAWASSPASLTAVMIRTLAKKALFYLAYVAVVMKTMVIRPEPFVVSLVIAFIALNVVQTWELKRLMDRPQGQGSSDR